jgi:hypothetical protein
MNGVFPAADLTKFSCMHFATRFSHHLIASYSKTCRDMTHETAAKCNGSIKEPRTERVFERSKRQSSESLPLTALEDSLRARLLKSSLLTGRALNSFQGFGRVSSHLGVFVLKGFPESWDRFLSFGPDFQKSENSGSAHSGFAVVQSFNQSRNGCGVIRSHVPQGFDRLDANPSIRIM